MKKRIFSLVLAILMVISILPAPTHATDVSEETPQQHPMMGELVAISPSTSVYYDAPGGIYYFVNVEYFADRMTVVAVDESTGTTYYQLDAASGCSWKADSLGNVLLFDGIWVKASNTIHLVYCEDCKDYNCGIDHAATTPTTPSEPDPCQCCESCTGKEGCECACDECDFLKKEHNVCETCGKEVCTCVSEQSEKGPICDQNCNANAVGSHSDACAVKIYYKDLFNNSTAAQLHALWATLPADAQDYILNNISWGDQTKRAALVELINSGAAVNPCGCCEACTGAEGCECACDECDFCEKEEVLTVGNIGLMVEGIPETVKLDAETAVPDSWNEEVFETVSGRKVVFAIDITLTENDAEWQPAEGQPATVTFDVSSLGLSEGEQIGIIHEHAGELKDLGSYTVTDGKLTVTTDGFSVFYGYTVDFEYDGVWYSIAGGSEVSLAVLFERLYISESANEVVDVQFSDSSLIEVRQENGTWYLHSLQAFTSEEKLTITLKNGSVLVINVYDATITDLNNQLNDAGKAKLTDITSGYYRDLPVNINRSVPYDYSDVIIGLPSGQVSYEIKIPTDFGVTQATSGFPEAVWNGCGLNQAVRGSDCTAVKATEANKQKIQEEYYVIYKNIQTTLNQRVDLKVSVVDYCVVANGPYYSPVPVIGLRITGFTDGGNALPGAMGRGVEWVTLKYEFIDEVGNPIEVKGNTTYYDVDYKQGVILHDNCDAVYIISSTDSNDRCQLYINDVAGEDIPNGYAIYEWNGQGTQGLPMVGSYCFTEAFAGKTITRSFVLFGSGGIFHNGTPAVRGTGNISLTKEVIGDVEPNRDYTFTISLEDTADNNTYSAVKNGENTNVTFNNGVAAVTLKANETITINNLPEAMNFSIKEHNTAGFIVSANGKTLDKHGSGNTEYVISEHITLRDQTTAVLFSNQANLVNLKIRKSGCDEIDANQTFLFRVAGEPEDDNLTDIDVTVIVQGNGYTVIRNLPVGHYTVTELSDWSWRYDSSGIYYGDFSENYLSNLQKSDNANSITVDMSQGNKQVWFVNNRAKNCWLSGDSYCENWWGGKDGTSVVRKEEE